jgi:hypothetical protein
MTGESPKKGQWLARVFSFRRFSSFMSLTEVGLMPGTEEGSKDAPAMERLKPYAFLGLQTSLGNYQVWVAMTEISDVDFARRLRNGTGSDPTASGATRVAGSQNFKAKIFALIPTDRDCLHCARPHRQQAGTGSARTCGGAGVDGPCPSSSFSVGLTEPEMAQLPTLS